MNRQGDAHVAAAQSPHKHKSQDDAEDLIHPESSEMQGAGDKQSHESETPANNDQVNGPATSTNKTKKHAKKSKKNKAPSACGVALGSVANKLQQVSINSHDGFEPAANEESATVDRIEQLARALDMLKEGSNGSDAERETSARLALEIVDSLRASVKRHVTTIGLLDTSFTVRRDALDSSRAIFLLNKYHRQLPEPPLRPHHLLWQRSQQEKSMSFVEKLQKRAGPALDFMEFLTFAAHTARVLSACGRKPQAKELLDLVERRLLKCKQRSPFFREYVTYFLDSRQSAGVDPATNPLTLEGERQLEWYASDNNIPDEATLLQLDMLYGYAVYLRLQCVESFSSPAFERFIDIIEATKTVEMDCVCVDNYVVAGAETEEKATELFQFLFEAAKASGLHFRSDGMILATERLELLGFEFSATEIVGKPL